MFLSMLFNCCIVILKTLLYNILFFCSLLTIAIQQNCCWQQQLWLMKEKVFHLRTASYMFASKNKFLRNCHGAQSTVAKTLFWCYSPWKGLFHLIVFLLHAYISPRVQDLSGDVCARGTFRRARQRMAHVHAWAVWPKKTHSQLQRGTSYFRHLFTSLFHLDIFLRVSFRECVQTTGISLQFHESVSPSDDQLQKLKPRGAVTGCVHGSLCFLFASPLCPHLPPDVSSTGPEHFWLLAKLNSCQSSCCFLSCLGVNWSQNKCGHLLQWSFTMQVNSPTCSQCGHVEQMSRLVQKCTFFLFPARHMLVTRSFVPVVAAKTTIEFARWSGNRTIYRCSVIIWNKWTGLREKNQSGFTARKIPLDWTHAQPHAQQRVTTTDCRSVLSVGIFSPAAVHMTLPQDPMPDPPTNVFDLRTRRNQNQRILFPDWFWHVANQKVDKIFLFWSLLVRSRTRPTWHCPELRCVHVQFQGRNLCSDLGFPPNKMKLELRFRYSRMHTVKKSTCAEKFDETLHFFLHFGCWTMFPTKTVDTNSCKCSANCCLIVAEQLWRNTSPSKFQLYRLQFVLFICPRSRAKGVSIWRVETCCRRSSRLPDPDQGAVHMTCDLVCAWLGGTNSFVPLVLSAMQSLFTTLFSPSPSATSPSETAHPFWKPWESECHLVGLTVCFYWAQVDACAAQIGRGATPCAVCKGKQLCPLCREKPQSGWVLFFCTTYFMCPWPLQEEQKHMVDNSITTDASVGLLPSSNLYSFLCMTSAEFWEAEGE